MSEGVTKTVHDRRSLNSDHRRHDRLLIARLAADDSYPTELDQARNLVATCPDCAALATDIRSISSTIGSMPTPRRTRDFRLTAEQADRLRGSWFERLMRKLAAPGWGMLRPVAGVAMSIGLVLVVVGAMPQVAPAGSGLEMVQPTSEDQDAASTQQPDIGSPADAPSDSSFEAIPPQEGPTTELFSMPGGEGNGPASPEGGVGAAVEPSPPPVTRTLNDAYLPTGADDDTGTSKDRSAAAVAIPREAVLFVGILVALAGLAVLVIVVYARRRYADPFLR